VQTGERGGRREERKEEDRSGWGRWKAGRAGFTLRTMKEKPVVQSLAWHMLT